MDKKVPPDFQAHGQIPQKIDVLIGHSFPQKPTNHKGLVPLTLAHMVDIYAVGQQGLLAAKAKPSFNGFRVLYRIKERLIMVAAKCDTPKRLNVCR